MNQPASARQSVSLFPHAFIWAESSGSRQLDQPHWLDEPPFPGAHSEVRPETGTKIRQRGAVAAQEPYREGVKSRDPRPGRCACGPEQGENLVAHFVGSPASFDLTRGHRMTLLWRGAQPNWGGTRGFHVWGRMESCGPISDRAKAAVANRRAACQAAPDPPSSCQYPNSVKYPALETLVPSSNGTLPHIILR